MKRLVLLAAEPALSRALFVKLGHHPSKEEDDASKEEDDASKEGDDAFRCLDDASWAGAD
jgi:hypothetical protein